MRATILLVAMLAATQAQTQPPAQTQTPQPPPAQAQQPPATEVYLVSLAEPAAWAEKAAELVVNISASPEYDNQPSFMRDSRSVLFTSRRDGQQTDIYRYWIADRKTTQVTNTAESEYSPTVTPRGDGFTVIQVEPDNAQRLKQFDLSGKLTQVVSHPDERGVGYHAWIDPNIVMLFIVGQQGNPSVLGRYQPGGAQIELITDRIGRSLVWILNTRSASFTRRDENGAWWFHKYDADERRVTRLVQAPPSDAGAEPYGSWTRDGRLISASGTKIYSWKQGEAAWTLVGDLATAPVKNISRIAVSPDGRWLAFVAEPRTE